MKYFYFGSLRIIVIFLIVDIFSFVDYPFNYDFMCVKL